MSRITRCPNCETLFKVVPDQLRLSQGWVRCGSCGAVFDAGEQMQHAEARLSSEVGEDGFSNSTWSLLLDDEERIDEVLRRSNSQAVKIDAASQYSSERAEKQAVTPAYSSMVEPELGATTTVVLTNASFGSASLVDTDELPSKVDLGGVPAVMPSAATGVDFEISALGDDTQALPEIKSPSPVASASAVQRKSQEARDIASHVIRRRGDKPKSEGEMPALVKASADADGTAAGAAVATAIEPAKAPSAPRIKESTKPKSSTRARSERPVFVPEPPVEESLSFVREAKRRQFWRQSWVRLLMVLVLALVFAGFGLRWVHEKRDWLAASYPDAKPYLNKLCGVLGCTVQPYRMLDGIAIESSTFNRAESGAFRLNLSLRNNERLELATPALELILTDADDRAVHKRVLTPKDLKAPTVMLPRRDWTGGLLLTLDGTLSSQVVGYRLMAFYP